MISKYFEDSYLFSFDSALTSFERNEDRFALILSDTIFYPQGGGQPYDKGLIQSDFFEFKVDKVVKDQDRILHFGELLKGDLKKGQVQMQIDRERRMKLSRIHSAGHMLDVAMLRIGSDLKPVKGYHFPDSPYVEYTGLIPEEKRAETIFALNESLKEIIAENHEIESTWVKGKDAVAELCPEASAYLDFNQAIRIVTVADKLGCPCAGTHIKRTSEANGIEVGKIKSKKGNTRISYSVLDEI